MKEKKVKLYADLIDSPERLAALIRDRRKRRQIIHICAVVYFVGTFVAVIGSLFDGPNAGTSLAMLAIFLGVLLAFEWEWQLLHIVQYLANHKSKPVDGGAGQLPTRSDSKK